MLLRKRFLLMLLLFLFFIFAADILRIMIYNDLKDELFHKNMALSGNFISSESMLMVLELLLVERDYEKQRRADFAPIWEAYLKGSEISELKSLADAQGWKNPEIMLIDPTLLLVTESTSQKTFSLRIRALEKMIRAGMESNRTLQSLPRYSNERGALLGLVYRYDREKNRFLVLQADYPSENPSVAHTLEYARKITGNLAGDAVLERLFFLVRYHDSEHDEHLTYFELAPASGMTPQDELDRALLLDRELERARADELVRMRFGESEIYLQKKRFLFGAQEIDLLLSVTLNETERQVRNDFVRLLSLFFWSGVGIFVAIFMWVFRRWLLKPIERIAQKMSQKELIPPEIAQNSSEFITLIKAHNQLLSDLQHENDFSKALLENQDNFIKDSIHDINTPLAVILLNIGLFELEMGENEYLTQIKSGVRTLQNTYGDLSYLLWRNQEGTSRTQELDLVEILRERIDFFRIVARADRKCILLHTDGKSIKVNMNSDKLKRLIDNNLSNAIKHSFQQSCIDVSVIRNCSKAFMSFSNRSNKIEDTQSIFLRYTRGSGLRAGYGIGLAIVKEICEEYGIEIEVTSESMTTFSYTFLIPEGGQNENYAVGR